MKIGIAALAGVVVLLVCNTNQRHRLEPDQADIGVSEGIE